ncbi:hypothetical protein [Ferruginibacter sp. SUN106]|uniref:hypothetical protein n=1 Tax=Ferruginibacter sp. SUN106 TaxID=2978348 RepID=UPI003D36CCFA
MGAWFYFAVTLVIELPIVLFFFKKERKFALLIGFLLNLFTWPVLHILLFYTSININILEIGVAITESIGYYLLMQCSWKKALALGFMANAMSYGIGLILNNYI